MGHSQAVTEGIQVEVSHYVAERSNPARDLYFFAYRIKITNEGSEPAQLISRHWIITDGEGRVEEVQGPGVVGKQPRLAPGESFEYTSFCPLHTARGCRAGVLPHAGAMLLSRILRIAGSKKNSSSPKAGTS